MTPNEHLEEGFEDGVFADDGFFSEGGGKGGGPLARDVRDDDSLDEFSVSASSLSAILIVSDMASSSAILIILPVLGEG